jgi:hypothetical protein
MKYRKLRMAWSVAWGVAAMLLVASRAQYTELANKSD